MIDAGMDVARLNYSHGTLEEHAETVRRVRDAAGRAGRPVAILQDLPGPKLRIGPLSDGVVELTPGERLTFSCGNEEVSGDAHHMSVSWGGLPEAIEKDAILYLADGSVRLRAVEVRAQQGEVEVEVEIGGAVASRQGLNVPGPLMTLPSLPEEDLGLLRHGESIGGRHGRAVVRPAARGCRIRAPPHAAAADRQDGEAPGGGTRRRDREGRGLRDGRPRRPRYRAADRTRADRAKAAARARRVLRTSVDHRDADARLDGRLLAADACRGRGCRERDPRRHRRGDALPGDGRGGISGRGGGDDGRRSRRSGVDRAV